VRKIVAQVEDRVEAGKPVIYIESIKMEIPVLSDDAGTVREVLVAENELVEQGQVVAILVD
jgi:acetyl-CoA carboxylase biotin carboxyl carrier protein